MVWSRQLDRHPTISVHPYNFQCKTAREVLLLKGVEKHTGCIPPLLAREILYKFYMYIYMYNYNNSNNNNNNKSNQPNE